MPEECRNPLFLSVLTVALAFMAQGCATEIPDVDTDRPEIRLTINGPGVGRIEMSNPPAGHWRGTDAEGLNDLEPDTDYSFVLSVSDPGGVYYARMSVPREILFVDVAPDTVVETESGIVRSLELLGNRSDPRTGLVISGTIRARRLANVFAFTFDTHGSDFGGTSGEANIRYLRADATVVPPRP